ncbi:MAG: XRE family transcriptional regulator, partial [Floccifex sp.]
VSFGVNRIVKVSMIKGGYDMLLQEGEYCKEEKIRNKKLDLFDGAYWCLIVAIYLAISFYSNRWNRTWIIWPVAGVLFVTVRSIALIFMKDENKL